jgi:nicotinate-nucleotide pyrophosphorylase (carboxylating)
MMDKNTREAADILIDLAFAEDIGDGDITTNNLIAPGNRRSAVMVAKDAGVIAGLPVAEMVFRRLDPALEWTELKPDGSHVEKGDVIVRFNGDYRALLTGERTALNFLQRLSGIATFSRQCAEAVKDFHTQILDTRKTIPGFRLLDKYAVRIGGATNHRIGLYDMVMIKDNHIEVAGGITNAVAAIRKTVNKNIKTEVETTTLEEVGEALEAGADIIMLDNMDTRLMAAAVKLIAGKAKTEASGNMTIERLREVAATGVDFISLGALTHSVKALDISQKIVDLP